MIIESLIKDESRITFDCAKATIHRGSRITLEDKYFSEPEIQNAISLGYCALVGAAPIIPQSAMKAGDPMVRFRNNFKTKLCFECIKDYADPGKIIRIPMSKLDEPEVRNAIAAGWLLNEDNPETNPVIYDGPPMRLEELTSTDIVDSALSASETEDLSALVGQPRASVPIPEGVPLTRPKQNAAKTPIKAKKISSTGEIDEEGGGGGSDLYKESKVIDQPSRPKQKAARPEIVNEEENPDADFDFSPSDIFKPKKK